MRRLWIIAVLWAVFGAMPRSFAAPLEDAWRHARIHAAKATLPHVSLLVHRNKPTVAAARKPVLAVAARPAAGGPFGDGDAILPVSVVWAPSFVTVPVPRETFGEACPHRFSFAASSSSPRDPPVLSPL